MGKDIFLHGILGDLHGDRCKINHWGPGGSLAENEFGAFFASQNTSGGTMTLR